jgi:hypothetical protein
MSQNLRQNTVGKLKNVYNYLDRKIGLLDRFRSIKSV